jgi:hypothetical protein
MPDTTGQMMAEPPPALVESVSGLTTSLTQARTLGKLSVRDRELVATAAAIAVGLTWGAIVQRAARELCTCRYVNQGLPDEAHAMDKNCPVHGKPEECGATKTLGITPNTCPLEPGHEGDHQWMPVAGSNG